MCRVSLNEDDRHLNYKTILAVYLAQSTTFSYYNERSTSPCTRRSEKGTRKEERAFGWDESH